MHLTHTKLKPTTNIDIDFNPSEVIKDIVIPEESQKIITEVENSKKTSDQYGYDLMILFDDNIVFGFDVFHFGKKIVLPELNPVTIFYSNAVMSHKNLVASQNTLIEDSPTLKNHRKLVDPKKFGFFFQLATNCIINLQATIETYANSIITDDYQPIDKNGEPMKKLTLDYKINTAIPEIKKDKFKRVNRKDDNIIRRIICLRNDIIHLKPSPEKTNTKYKDLYQRLIKFDYTTAIFAVRNFVNFYDSGLIEECSCGKEYYYDLNIIDKK
ncbi:hypothetical protein [Aequorivita lipolytica]|uniref:ApeA N-terminal domain-containing protein n=1 Tax=Aequorivita lipolytica TaxID=153267 RepID=A0A5C6YP29_9FLAO|nr:hypothetical protein [Aequorivita lipolytica]TXD69113.1 hypothetical protein ESV24_08695 [Aequorivita lipolytica]SRX51314.1 hypothetical protein AEQU2_01794 [Aequorivita lipolytica]